MCWKRHSVSFWKLWGEYCAAGESIIYWCILLVERDANGSNITNEKPRCSVMSADSMPSKDSWQAKNEDFMYGDANLPNYNDFLKVEECAHKNGFNSSTKKKKKNVAQPIKPESPFKSYNNKAMWIKKCNCLPTSYSECFCYHVQAQPCLL